MKHRIGLIIDKPYEKSDSQELKQADGQKKATSDAIYQILNKKFEIKKIHTDEKIVEALSSSGFDIVFNLSTGVRGESRQSQIPALLEMLGIPYVGSGIMAHSLALNKAVAKQIMCYHGISTPGFQVFNTGEENIDDRLRFPLIIKPSCEGSGFGIHKDSVVCSKGALQKKVKELLGKFQPPVLAEEFIEGREFTVGIIGNGKDKTVLPVMEIDFEDVPAEYGSFYTYEVKHEWGHKTKYHCPANINEELRNKIAGEALSVFEALGCRDIVRVDLRVRNNKPYVIEINSLPGLRPGYSDLPKMAAAAGISYEELIFSILDAAVKRIKANKNQLF